MIGWKGSRLGVGVGFTVARNWTARRQVRGRRANRRFTQALMLAAVMALSSPSEARCPDLALVLAIDASGSVAASEFQLQLQGYSAALKSAAVQQAIRSVGEVDVAVVVWADSAIPAQVLPFRNVSFPKAASQLADRILGLRRVVTGNTGIGRGLWTALDLIEQQVPCAVRRVVNVSGDGKESFGPRPRNAIPLDAARLRAETMDVTVNALAIQTDVKDLGDWYRGNLIIGTGAFVMNISALSSFAEAIEHKLVREISNPMLAQRGLADEIIFD